MGAVIPSQEKAAVAESLERSIELVSDAHLAEELEAAGVDTAQSEAILDLYRSERTRAFRSSLGIDFFVGLFGLVVSMRLPKGTLVELREPRCTIDQLIIGHPNWARPPVPAD